MARAAKANGVLMVSEMFLEKAAHPVAVLRGSVIVLGLRVCGSTRLLSRLASYTKHKLLYVFRFATEIENAVLKTTTLQNEIAACDYYAAVAELAVDVFVTIKNDGLSFEVATSKM